MRGTFSENFKVAIQTLHQTDSTTLHQTNPTTSNVEGWNGLLQCMSELLFFKASMRQTDPTTLIMGVMQRR